MKITVIEWITTEEITKERKRKNIIEQTVKRRTVKNLVLECGHKIPVLEFCKIPEKNTRCKICE